MILPAAIAGGLFRTVGAIKAFSGGGESSTTVVQPAAAASPTGISPELAAQRAANEEMDRKRRQSAAGILAGSGLLNPTASQTLGVG